MDWKEACVLAAQKIQSADALLIATGAGMGVDSGLPDFRGKEGFWKAYPPFAKLGLSFAEAANPKWFFQQPERAWGFYGHRYNLYSQTEPHEGFQILKSWCEDLGKSYFVFTSNVDGHFQKSGFDDQKIVECHGSINHWQCAICCTETIGAMEDFEINVDESNFLAVEPLPRCPNCDDMARPNVLMFGDYQWIESRTHDQVLRYNQWHRELHGKSLVSIEIGAGTAVPTVRWETESQESTLIRINPREPDVPSLGIPIPAGALEALREINHLL